MNIGVTAAKIKAERKNYFCVPVISREKLFVVCGVWPIVMGRNFAGKFFAAGFFLQIFRKFSLDFGENSLGGFLKFGT